MTHHVASRIRSLPAYPFAVLTEKVFSWTNGLGTYMVNAALKTNHSVLMGCMLLFATTFILVNLAVDLLYGFIDPRIRHGRS